MMMPSHKVRILVAAQPVDFRKGHDGLAALVQSMLQEDPFTGTVFVFRAKRADRLKILFWEDEEDQETVRTLLVERVDIGTEGLNVRLRVDGLSGLAREMLSGDMSAAA